MDFTLKTEYSVCLDNDRKVSKYSECLNDDRKSLKRQITPEFGDNKRFKNDSLDNQSFCDSDNNSLYELIVTDDWEYSVVPRCIFLSRFYNDTLPAEVNYIDRKNFAHRIYDMLVSVGYMIRWRNCNVLELYLYVTEGYRQFYLPYVNDMFPPDDSISSEAQTSETEDELSFDINNFVKMLFVHSKDKFNSSVMTQSFFDISSEFVKRMETVLTHLRNDIYSFLRKLGYTIKMDIDFIFHLMFGLYRLICFDNKLDLFMTLGYIVYTFLGTALNDSKDLINIWLNNFIHDVKSYGKLKSESMPMGLFMKDGFFSFKKAFDIIIESKLTVSIRTLVLQLVGLKFFPRDTANKFINILGTPKDCNLVDFGRSLIDSIEQLINFSINATSGKSFIESLILEDPVVAFLESTYPLTMEYKAIYVGDAVNFPSAIAEGQIPANEFLKKLRLKIIEGVLLQGTLHKKKITNPFVARMFALKDIFRELNLKLRSKNRRAPMGIILFGSPSIGKSSLLVHIYQLFCEYKGYEYSHDLVYNRNPKSKYWTGHEPLTQPIIHYPELGSVAKWIVEKQGDEAIDEMLMVADTQPYSAEMADVESKGKCMVMPELLVIDCNDPEMNVQHIVNNPAAIRRRFLYIKAIVKPEYRVPGSDSLDKAAVADLDNKMDLWNFEIYREIPVNNKMSNKDCYKSSDGKPFDIYSLSDKILELLALHDKEQDAFGEATSEGVKKYIGKKNSISSESQEVLMPFWILSCLMYLSSLFVCPFTSTFGLLFYLIVRAYLEFQKQSLSLICWMMLRFFIIYSYYGASYRIKSKWLDYKDDVTSYAMFSYLFVKTIFIEDGRFEYYRIQVRNSTMYMKFSYTLIVFTVTLSFVKIILSLFDFFGGLTSEGNVVSSSEIFTPENIEEKIDDVEIKAGCSFPLPKKKNDTDKSYDEVAKFVPRYISDKVTMNAPEEIKNVIENNVCYLKVNHNGKPILTKGVGLCKDYLILNKHCFFDGDSVEISRSEIASSIVRVIFSNNNYYRIGEDIILIRVIGWTFRDLRPYLFDIGNVFITNSGYFLGKKNYEITRSNSVYEIKNKDSGNYSLTHPYEYNFVGHANGMCGSPLIVTLNNRTFFAGIHSAGHDFTSRCYASVLNKTEAFEGVKFLDDKFLLNITSQGMIRLPKNTSLSDVTSKSPLLYEQALSLTVLGSISNYKFVSPKTRLIESKLIPDIESLVGISPYGDNGKLKYLPPQMKSKIVDGKYISPYNIWIKKVGVIKKTLNINIMDQVSLSIIKLLTKRLSDHGIKELHPFPLEVAQNGYPLNFYIRAMNNSTSAGFLFPGKKSNYTRDISLDFKTDSKDPNFDIKEQVMEIIMSYERDEMCYSIVGAQLKDESRSYEKAVSGKTRVFAMSSYDMTLVNRMFLMPFYSLMCSHRDLFYTKVGINMHSNESDHMFRLLRDFSPFIMEGDYGGYDTSMPVGIGLMANTIVYEILKNMGYNSYSLNIVKGILSENLFPTVSMEGNIFIAPGFQPSGKYATAEDNSLRGVVLMYYAYAVMCTKVGENSGYNLTTQFKLEDFEKYLLPVTYGDDMLCSVKPEISIYFNNITYAKFVVEVYGMEFTTSGKSSHNSKFIDIDNISFLKRKFVFNNLLKRYVAVLDKESIVKSLSHILPSKEVSIDVQLVETMASSLRELFFYCHSVEEYDEYRNKFIQSVVKHTTFLDVEVRGYFPLGNDLLNQYL